jgi:hypothetical protein
MHVVLLWVLHCLRVGLVWGVGTTHRTRANGRALGHDELLCTRERASSQVNTGTASHLNGCGVACAKKNASAFEPRLLHPSHNPICASRAPTHSLTPATPSRGAARVSGQKRGEQASSCSAQDCSCRLAVCRQVLGPQQARRNRRQAPCHRRWTHSHPHANQVAARLGGEDRW